MIGGDIMSILLYADDIVLTAPTTENLQALLDVADSWCRKCGMVINAAEAQVLHVRNHQRPRSAFQFTCGEAKLDYTDHNKYLGYIIHDI